MMNSMWSGVLGLRSHQTSMDVIGNDIANVNTTGFKQSNVSFADTLYNNIAGEQVGIGSNISSVTRDFNDGALRETDVETNLALSGSGFFVLKDAAGTNTTYTRAGDFGLSNNNDGSPGTVSLTNGDGQYLYGTSGAAGSASSRIEIPADARELIISTDGMVSYVNSSGTLVENAWSVDVAQFANPGGLMAVGGNQYQATNASGTEFFNADDGTFVLQGYLENSNVDLATEFTEMIMAERGFQANSKTITTSDSMLQELLNIKR